MWGLLVVGRKWRSRGSRERHWVEFVLEALGIGRAGLLAWFHEWRKAFRPCLYIALLVLLQERFSTAYA